MSTKVKANSQPLTIGALRDVQRLCAMADYNAKVNLKIRDIPFKGMQAFTMPNMSPELSRQYLLRNLAELKEKLTALSLPAVEITSPVDNEAVL